MFCKFLPTKLAGFNQYRKGQVERFQLSFVNQTDPNSYFFGKKKEEI